MIVKDYILFTSTHKRIRNATKVILPNGKEIRFMEKLSKKQAIRETERRHHDKR